MTWRLVPTGLRPKPPHRFDLSTSYRRLQKSNQFSKGTRQARAVRHLKVAIGRLGRGSANTSVVELVATHIITAQIAELHCLDSLPLDNSQWPDMTPKRADSWFMFLSKMTEPAYTIITSSIAPSSWSGHPKSPTQSAWGTPTPRYSGTLLEGQTSTSSKTKRWYILLCPVS